jgi:exonuclease SbcD
MRLLHTADWHLGKSFRGLSLLEDQRFILDQILDAAKTYEVDVLILAGDVYDKPSPPEGAVSLFRHFLERFYAETDAAFVAIAGNHDSGHRLGVFEKLLDPKRILIRGPLQAEEPALILQDEHGSVAFSAVPYGEIYAARRVFEDESIQTPEDVLRAELQAARKAVPEGARWVVSAHAFVTGGLPSDSERPLAVGRVETVSNNLFDGAAYVALGHLHRAQQVGRETIRYSGSPLVFDFDEAGSQKSCMIVDLDADGVSHMEQIDLHPVRKVREVRGLLADLLDEAEKEPSEDYLRAVLLDEGALVDPVSQLRPFYPNVMQVQREKRQDMVLGKAGRATSKLSDPSAVISEFVEFVRGEAVSDGEDGVIHSLLGEPVREDV